MISRRVLTFVAMAIWTAVAVTAAPRAFSRHHSESMVIAADIPSASCADFRPQFDHHDAVYQSEERSISKTEAPLLRVLADSNGALRVEGSDKDTYSVTLCKAAESGSDADAVLAQIHLSLNHGELRITAPSGKDGWVAHLLIRTPKGAALDIQVHNGPVSLEHVDGHLKVRAENGPVSVKGCTGELDLSAHNGPVTLADNSGKQTVRAENGPITLSLSGNSWDGAGLEASTTNGPVTLKVPSGYQSGVVLESEGNGPLQCRASVCSEGRKTWDDDHKRVEFGSGPTVIRVSSVNGPVSVR